MVLNNSNQTNYMLMTYGNTGQRHIQSAHEKAKHWINNRGT